MDVCMRRWRVERTREGRERAGGVNEKIKGRCWWRDREERVGREVEGSKESTMEGREDTMRRREETRTRRAAQHANIGFSIRTFGPSARETFI